MSVPNLPFLGLKYEHHLDRSTERELSVALGEVKVAKGKVCSGDVDGQKDSRSSRLPKRLELPSVQLSHEWGGGRDRDTDQVLDVDVAAVLSGRDRPCALRLDLLERCVVDPVLPDVRSDGVRRQGDSWGAALVSGDELTLPLVPSV